MQLNKSLLPRMCSTTLQTYEFIAYHLDNYFYSSTNLDLGRLKLKCAVRLNWKLGVCIIYLGEMLNRSYDQGH